MSDIKELEELGLQAMKNFWGIENGIVESMNKQQLNVLIQKAKLGMQFYREVNIHNRAIESNTLRVCTMVAENKNELKRLLKASLPDYVISEK